MATEKRLIYAHDLWSDIMMLPHNGDMISSEEVEQAIQDAPTVDAVPVDDIRLHHILIDKEGVPEVKLQIDDKVRQIMDQKVERLDKDLRGGTRWQTQD